MLRIEARVAELTGNVETGSSSFIANPQPSVLPRNSELNTANSTSNQDDQVPSQDLWPEVRENSAKREVQRLSEEGNGEYAQETDEKDEKTNDGEKGHHTAQDASDLHWKVLGTVRSPGLSQLLRVLKVEECEDIPLLNLDDHQPQDDATSEEDEQEHQEHQENQHLSMKRAHSLGLSENTRSALHVTSLDVLSGESLSL
jgi:hypothetical protein